MNSTDAVHLIAVAGADAAARGADGGLAGLLFFGLVESGVVRQHHVGVIGNEQAAFGVDTLGVQVGDFGQGLHRVQHHAVADDANFVVVHNAGGNQVEHELLVAHFDGVASVCAALETHDVVCVQRQKINYLGLAFVTPLGTDYNTICHISFILLTARRRKSPKGAVPRVDCLLNDEIQAQRPSLRPFSPKR